jgi:hypothetical protein
MPGVRVLRALPLTTRGLTPAVLSVAAVADLLAGLRPCFLGCGKIF